MLATASGRQGSPAVVLDLGMGTSVLFWDMLE